MAGDSIESFCSFSIEFGCRFLAIDWLLLFRLYCVPVHCSCKCVWLYVYWHILSPFMWIAIFFGLPHYFCTLFAKKNNFTVCSINNGVRINLFPLHTNTDIRTAHCTHIQRPRMAEKEWISFSYHNNRIIRYIIFRHPSRKWNIVEKSVQK